MFWYIFLRPMQFLVQLNWVYLTWIDHFNRVIHFLMLLCRKCQNSYHRDVTQELLIIYSASSEVVFWQMPASVECRNHIENSIKYTDFNKRKTQKSFPYPIGGGASGRSHGGTLCAPGEGRLRRDIVVVTARSHHARHRPLRQEVAQTQAALQTLDSKPRQLYLNA